MLLNTTLSSGTLLRESGLAEQPASGSTFSIHRPDTVWFVQSGKLDLFLVETRGGEPNGARYPAHRVETGHAVFGIEDRTRPISLMAAVSPSTELVRMEWNRVREMIAAGNEFASYLLEDWVAGLTAALARDIAPGTFISLEADQTVQVPETQSRMIASQQVLWVRHQRGHSKFLSQPDLPSVNGGGFFPVSRYGWLEAEPGSTIEALPSSRVGAADPAWNGLREFHSLVMSCLLAQREKAYSSQEESMRVREAADRATLRGSMLRLAAPLHKVNAAAAVDGECRNPIFIACQAIGRQLGVAMKPHPDMLRGIPLADPVAAVAKASNVRARAIVLDGRWWTDENPPLLAYREADHSPVALLRRSARNTDLFDPITRTLSPVDQDTARTLNPCAYVFYRPFGSEPLAALDLVKFGLRGCAKEIGLVFFGGFAAGLLGLLAPLATAVVFDDLIPGAERDQLIQMSVLLAIIALASALLMYVRDFAVLRLEGKLDASLQAAVWDRLLGLPVSFFRNYSAGDLAQRSMGISRIRQTLTGHTLSAVLSGIFSVFSFFLLFYFSWPLALLSGGMVAIAVGVSVICGSFQVRKQRKVYALQGTISSKLIQFITGIGKLRTSGTERRAFSVWANEFSEQKECYASGRRISIILTCFNSVYPVACLGIIFACYGLFAGSNSTLTTGRFLAFTAAFMQFLSATLMFISTVISAINIVPIYERAKPILRAIPEVTEAKASPGKLTGAIEINNLSFRYGPDLPPILRDISLKIEPGQFVAFVGSSGGGKSTLFRLLLGFETPDTGALYFDGQDLSGLDLQSVRKQIGVVLQSSRPFVGSLFINIVGSGPYTLEEAQEAARLAGLEEDIQRMPMGLHTVVADGGAGISGGQRQRLMIARALIGRPRILLFDEATSALDNRTQESVSRSLESLQATRIVIAHRLSTIMNADKIFVLDKGTVVQQGTYQQLIAEEGLFQVLAKRQMS